MSATSEPNRNEQATKPVQFQTSLLVRGARVHNLKNITVEIPHEKLTVVTGVSGSGKSSLVFDTIYAEGQRRYVESLSAYARQFLERIEKPDVDEIEGIAPPIAIHQKATGRTPRSTVATSTEIYDYLRLLFGRAGDTYCPQCGQKVEQDTVDQVARKVMAYPEGSRWYVLYPLRITTTNPELLKVTLQELRSRGFHRLFQNGQIYDLGAPEKVLEIDFSQPVYVLVDRLVLRADTRQRLVDGVEICYREAGIAILRRVDGEPLELQFDERFACKRCNIEFPIPEPRLFSFNSPYGACPTCQGFGNIMDYDIDLIVPDQSLSLAQGAIDPWNKPQFRWWFYELKSRAKGKVRLNVPWRELTEEEKKFVLEGDETFDGVKGFFKELEGKRYKVHVRVFLSRYRGYPLCPDCKGARLRKEALNVRVGGKTIFDVVRMSVAEACDFFDHLVLEEDKQAIAERVLTEIRQRLRFLRDVGLEYLTLDRLSSTLSGGEAQRIQLATCLGSQLVGACYVLDEPSIGLHPRDTHRLIRILRELRDLGNTVIVVEHDAEMIREADYIVDLGPGAGEHGGQVLYAGALETFTSNTEQSLTAKYLRGDLQVTPPRERRRSWKDKNRLLFTGCRIHNLKNIDVSIPLQVMTVITGVSGSGKSTLVYEVIYKSLQAAKQAYGSLVLAPSKLTRAELPKLTCDGVEGANEIRDVILVDQSPIGRSPRSNPATYVGIFDEIRQLFASTEEARKRGYTARYFSFNLPGGRCDVCQGEGVVKVEMQFLADVELVCEECGGKRFKSGVLEVRFRGLNIYEVLQLSVSEAVRFFEDHPQIVSKLRVLEEVGLGYMKLGQPATTLSGGEAQRVKLAAHLASASCEDTLFIFDEPTTGLHFHDIASLLKAFDRLIENGGTVLIIEHNLDVIKAADYVIDLGPEGGDRGGQVVATGTPEEIAGCISSYTGQFLRRVLNMVA